MRKWRATGGVLQACGVANGVLASKLGVRLANAVDGDGNGVDGLLHHADADRCAAADLRMRSDST
jgi:hypothetical protein